MKNSKKNNKGKISFILADDHEIIRQGFKEAALVFEGFECIDLVSDGEQLIEQYFKYKPDVIVTDIRMPGVDGLKAVNFIKEKDNNVKSLFLSVTSDFIDIYNVFCNGGMGLVNKSTKVNEIFNAIKKVASGEYYFGEELSQDDIFRLIGKIKELNNWNRKNEAAFINLSNREKEAFYLIAEGYTSRQVAEKMNVSLKTVEYYRKNIRTKLNLRNRSDYSKYLLKNNMF